MAERRMFAKTIIDSDAFLDMPVTARLLYYDLSMRADDDGFVNSPKKIMRIVGASADDLSILAARKFIIPFDVGVVVIKHWRIHNYIRKDMYHETKYKEQKQMLDVDENGAYRLPCDDSVTAPLQSRNEDVTSPSTQVRLGQDSIGQDKKREGSTPSRMTRPSAEDVEAYCRDKGITIDAQAFVDYYTANGWRVGKAPMKSWQAAVRNWARRDAERQAQAVAPKRTTSFHNFEQRDTAGGSWSELDTFTPDEEEEDDEAWEDILTGFKTARKKTGGSEP